MLKASVTYFGTFRRSIHTDLRAFDEDPGVPEFIGRVRASCDPDEQTEDTYLPPYTPVDQVVGNRSGGSRTYGATHAHSAYARKRER
jgi:hypothetical protein